MKNRIGASVVALVLCSTMAPTAACQISPSVKYVQTGPGLLPGAGIQINYVAPRRMYTREASIYAHATLAAFGGKGSVHTAAGLGGSVRIIGIGETIGAMTPRDLDVDVGIRFGPGLFFALKETRFEKNQRFFLFVEPFVRIASTLGTSRPFFLEVGIQRPAIRLGVLVAI